MTRNEKAELKRRLHTLEDALKDTKGALAYALSMYRLLAVRLNEVLDEEG